MSAVTPSEVVSVVVGEGVIGDHAVYYTVTETYADGMEIEVPHRTALDVIVYHSRSMSSDQYNKTIDILVNDFRLFISLLRER